MINCNISGLGSLCGQLVIEQMVCGHKSSEEPYAYMSSQDVEKYHGWLKIARSCAKDFEWEAVNDRIDIFSQRLDKGTMTYDRCAQELRVLKETIDLGMNNQFIYRYPRVKSSVLKRWKTDWADVIKAFPSTHADVFAAVDCWALSHGTASVFHSMRVLEYGLGALADDVGKSFDIQNWQNIINEIEAAIRDSGKTLPRGNERTERLKFLSEAAKEFSYFKDGWRNHVAHNRTSYDEHQAFSALEHVRAFMTVLASRLSEAVAEAEHLS